MNTLKAARLMSDNYAHFGDNIRELELKQGEEIDWQVKSAGTELNGQMIISNRQIV